MAILSASRGAEQRDHIVAVHRAGRPYLLPVDPPAARGALGAGANARKVRSRSRLAHPDAEEQFAAANARQIKLALRLGPVIQDQRRALPVGDPVRRHRRAGRQQFLDDDEPRERAALAAAIDLGKRQAEQPCGAQLAAEIGVEPLPRPGADVGGPRRRRRLGERADAAAQRLILGRQAARFQRVEHNSLSRGDSAKSRSRPLLPRKSRRVTCRN